MKDDVVARVTIVRGYKLNAPQRKRLAKWLLDVSTKVATDPEYDNCKTFRLHWSK